MSFKIRGAAVLLGAAVLSASPFAAAQVQPAQPAQPAQPGAQELAPAPQPVAPNANNQIVIQTDQDATVAVQPGPPPSDAEIAQFIQARLVRDPAVTADNLRVEVVDGIVVLRGEVPHLLEADRARRLAEGVRGVTQVMTEIQVGEPEEVRDDEELRQEVIQALQDDAATGRYDLEVSVENGQVTVTGSVASREELNLVRRVARDVEGVRSVNHAITVGYALSAATQRGTTPPGEVEPEEIQVDDPEQERTDIQIAQDIRRRLEYDAYVDARRIEIEVQDGVVTLRGNVVSPAERTNAVYRAWVRGVEEVDEEGLKVVPGATLPPVDEPLPPRTDEDLQQAVERSLRETPRVSPFDVNVRVNDGVVTLSGNVDHVAARREAEDAARQVRGVLEVENELSVAAGEQRLEDEQVRAAVHSAILRSPHLNREEISVQVTDGVVQLTGNVETLYQKALADNLVGRVRGVLGVDNRLGVERDTLEAQPLVVDPRAHELDYTRYGWWRDRERPAAPLRSDADILRAIENQILWSPYLTGTEVDVLVEDGVATLSGSVATEAARRVAHMSALEGGASAVVNNIIVRG